MYTDYTVWKALKDAGYPQRDFANFAFDTPSEPDAPVDYAMIVPLEELIDACYPHFRSLTVNKEPFENGTQWFVNYYQPTGECDASGKTASEALVNLWVATRLPKEDIYYPDIL